MDPIVLAALANFGMAAPQVNNSINGPDTSMRAAGAFAPDAFPAGTSVNPIDNKRLFVKLRKASDWGRYVSIIPTGDATGTLDTLDLNTFRLAPSGNGRSIPSRSPDFDTKSWSTGGLSGSFKIQLKGINALKKAGRDPKMLIETGIAQGVANLLLDVGINGDRTLPGDSDENILRRTNDGWFTRARAAGRVTSDDNGSIYHPGLFPGLLDQLDDTYRADRALQWGYSDRISTRYLVNLTNMANGLSPAIVNEFGANVGNVAGNSAMPLGKPGIIIPQIGSQRWGAEGYAGVAPTSITDNGDGTLTINLNTLAASVNRGASGPGGQRYVTVTCKLTGLSETLPVSYSSPNNTVTTVTRLGQVTGGVSTTAAQYSVRWADLTTVAAALWNHFFIVIRDGVRMYTVFHAATEELEVFVHTDVGYAIMDADAMHLADNIIAPRNSIIV